MHSVANERAASTLRQDPEPEPPPLRCATFRPDPMPADRPVTEDFPSGGESLGP